MEQQMDFPDWVFYHGRDVTIGICPHATSPGSLNKLKEKHCVERKFPLGLNSWYL